jgi:Flp pilus assembly protein TadD
LKKAHPMNVRFARRLLTAALFSSLAACQSLDLSGAARVDASSITASTRGALDNAARRKGGDEDLALGKEHFRNANYGLAERHFRLAVEQSQDSLEALIGLAASYDQLGRFDLSDRAYTEAVRIGGRTSAVLNNRGYSYYLRRDFRRAKADFQQALRSDPDNAMAKRNLALVAGRA